MDIDETMDTLQRALDMENWAVDIYEGYLNKTGNKKAKIMFAKQAEQSATHACQITQLIEQLKISKETESPSNVGDMLHAAKSGLQEEQVMRDFYKHNLTVLKDAKVKSLFKHLLKEEKSHIKEVSSLIKYLERLSKKSR